MNSSEVDDINLLQSHIISSTSFSLTPVEPPSTFNLKRQEKLNLSLKRYAYLIGKSSIFQKYIDFKNSRAPASAKNSQYKLPIVKDSKTNKENIDFNSPETISMKNSPYVFTSNPHCKFQL